MLRLLSIALVLAASSTVPVLAQEQKPKPIVVTADEVTALSSEVDRLLAAKDCERAALRLPVFIDAANAYANFIGAGIRPYDDFPAEYRSSTGDLAKELEGGRKRLTWTIEQRNLAWVSLGDCMSQLGQKDAAAGAYLQALELLNGNDERDTWQSARTGLWKLIGVLN